MRLCVHPNFMKLHMTYYLSRTLINKLQNIFKQIIILKIITNSVDQLCFAKFIVYVCLI